MADSPFTESVVPAETVEAPTTETVEMAAMVVTVRTQEPAATVVALLEVTVINPAATVAVPLEATVINQAAILAVTPATMEITPETKETAVLLMAALPTKLTEV